MDLLSLSNPISICRICLLECSKLISLFDTAHDNIFYCLNLSMKRFDNVSNHICSDCLIELETVVKFKKKCEKSEHVFRQYIEQNCNKTTNEKDNQIANTQINHSSFLQCTYKKQSLTLSYDDKINIKKINTSNLNKNQNIIEKKEKGQINSNCLVNESCINDENKLNKNLKLKCDTCNLQCQNKWVLKVHMRTHSGEKPFQCDLCKKCFVSNSNMRMHKRLTHNGDKQVCSECGKSFSCLTYLKRHLIIHFKVKPYGCTICQKRFTTKSYLKEHIARHKGDKKFFCEICASKFISDVNLKQHMLVHGIQKRNFKRHKCTFCDYKTTGKVDLARHIRKHTGEKPFHCPEEGCQSAFAGKASLKLHIRIHTGEKPYICSECPTKFSRGDKYKNHMLKKHNISKLTSNKRSKLVVKELAEAVENGEQVSVPIDILKISNTSE